MMMSMLDGVPSLLLPNLGPFGSGVWADWYFYHHTPCTVVCTIVDLPSNTHTHTHCLIGRILPLLDRLTFLSLLALYTRFCPPHVHGLNARFRVNCENSDPQGSTLLYHVSLLRKVPEEKNPESPRCLLVKIIDSHFFVGKCIFNDRNEFYTWSHFKNK